MIKEIFTKERIMHFAVLLLVISAYFYPYFNIHTMPARGDDPDIVGVHTNDLMALLAIYPMEIRKVMDEYGQFPFWSPYRLSGTPIFSKPQAVFFYINMPLILFAPTVFAGIKWSILLHFVIAALAMYALMYYLSKNNLVAFVTSFIYIFNGYQISRLNWGQTNVLYPYAWFPLVFLFTFYAIERREWLLHSIIIGVLFSFIVLSGGSQIFMYLSVLYFYFLALYFVLNFSVSKLVPNLIKISRIGIISIIVFFGLTAVFLLPNSDLLKISVRAQGYSYEQSVGGPLTLNLEFVKSFASPHLFKVPQSDWGSLGIGLIPAILIPLSLFYFRKKKVILFLLLAIITILIFQGSFLFYIFWKLIPQFQQAKGMFKGHALIFFAFSILAGYGFMYILEKTQKLSKNARHIIVYPMIILIIINLTIFNNKLTMMTDIENDLSKNQVLNYIAEDKELHRFRMQETNGIDWGTDHYDVTLGIQDVYGTENIWPVEYLPFYLSFANQFPAKGYGILNTKYITSTKELNISGYTFAKKFEECGYYQNGADICQPRKSDGPYLYVNEKFLPRAYFVNQSILIIGNKDRVLQVSYFLMSNDAFTPSSIAIVQKYGSVSGITNTINKFNAVVLTEGSLDANAVPVLQNYVMSGGILLPNIVKDEKSLTQETVNEMWKSFAQQNDYSKADKAEIKEYMPNKIIIKTQNKKGILVMSELFSLYPGWKAFDNNGNELGILTSNGAISAVMLSGNENEITFVYSERSFKKGAIISMITFILIICYFIYYFTRKRKNNTSSHETAPVSS